MTFYRRPISQQLSERIVKANLRPDLLTWNTHFKLKFSRAANDINDIKCSKKVSKLSSTKTFPSRPVCSDSVAWIEIYFESGESPLLCFDVLSALWDKTLWTFSARLIPAGSKELSWMIFPNDIMARLAAMFHAAFCESKLLAQGGYQTLTKSSACTVVHMRTHPSTHPSARALKHLFLPFLCLHVFDFFLCSLKLSLLQRWKESHCNFWREISIKEM